MKPLPAHVRQLRATEALAALVGESSKFVEILRQLPSIASGDATVLITGETGTGKELVARAIHYLSPRAALPFVPLNCGALPETLLEAELFGHERGAFTDARGARPGLVQEAEGGTLCLDEADSLSPRGQVALLRLLDHRTFRSVGSSREQLADVRFVAMTNARLPESVARRDFRADLYYRLSVLTVELPPLRDRADDAVILAEHFLRIHTPPGTAIPAFSSGAIAALRRHDWPGNVRELENTVLRAVQSSRGSTLTAEHLGLSSGDRHLDELHSSFAVLKRRAIDTFEHGYLTELMRQSGGNVTRAARAAGKDRRDFGRLLKKHHLDHLRGFPPHAGGK